MQKTDQIEKMLALVEDFESENLNPILVGGMALVLLGSQRVTKDFDFVITRQDSVIETTVTIFYKHGFELISKFTPNREVLRTVDNVRVASARLKLDVPDSAFFFHKDLRMKVDVLIDFPILAKELVSRSQKVKLRSTSIRIPCQEDLIRLKETAYADRKSASDAQDLEFLRSLK